MGGRESLLGGWLERVLTAFAEAPRLPVPVPTLRGSQLPVTLTQDQKLSSGLGRHLHACVHTSTQIYEHK